MNTRTHVIIVLSQNIRASFNTFAQSFWWFMMLLLLLLLWVGLFVIWLLVIGCWFACCVFFIQIFTLDVFIFFQFSWRHMGHLLHIPFSHNCTEQSKHTFVSVQILQFICVFFSSLHITHSFIFVFDAIHMLRCCVVYFMYYVVCLLCCVLC